ncbi:MAG: haloacid dehalogenase-like hydrolase [Lachnospiraceae bacterium]|nr:haloacid dehalogenase-like hydrolase [Lachnospiraceae bacterium]
MKTKKRILAAVLIMALLTALTGCSTYPDVTIDLTTGEVRIGDQAAGDTQAKYNEAEPAGVKGELLYWSEDSAAAASIRDYVAEVTDINSDKYIPVEDRIAVFDMDGTLIGELYPSYFEYMMFIHRALHDDTFEAPDDMREFAEALEDGVYGGKVPDNSELLHAKYAGQAYAGMTVEEMRDYTRAFMQTEADGFTNLTKGDAFYWPMVSLVQYLADNDFTCYIVSGSSRTICREVIADWLPIPDNRVIGMSYSMLASGQGDTDGLEYVYSADDKVILGEDLILKTIKMNKVSAISQEIGKVPVLSFGNSSGDVSMAQYVLNNDQYETKAFMLPCDDLVREHGNMDKANAMLDTCNERGFEPISMRDDFATIYGDEVEPVDYEGPEGEALEPAA